MSTQPAINQQQQQQAGIILLEGDTVPDVYACRDGHLGLVMIFDLVDKTWRPRSGIQDLVAKIWTPRSGNQDLVAKIWYPGSGMQVLDRQNLVSRIWSPDLVDKIW